MTKNVERMYVGVWCGVMWTRCVASNVNPFKGQRCQLVTLGHPRLTYIYNFCHSGTLALKA